MRNGSRQDQIGVLLLGYDDKQQLIYAGKVVTILLLRSVSALETVFFMAQEH
jgi:hypothetical protein